MESTKKYGVCRDANNKLIGKYVYLEKEDDQYLIKLCKSWLETYRQNTNFFLSIDLETQSLDYINDTILLYSISWNGKQAVVFSPHFMWGLFSSKGQGESWDLFLEVLKTIPINNQNIKFDAKWWLSQYGILVNIIFDPMIAAQLCYAGGFPGNRFSLDNLAKYLLYPMEISKGFQTSFIGQPVTQRCTFDQIHYAANDSLVTHRLVEPLVTRLKTNELWNLWEEVELPLLSSLIVSEVKGVKIDVPSVKAEYEKAKEVHLEIGKQLQLEYQKIPEETRPQFPGNEFNPNSPKQIEQILNSVGIRVPKTSKDALSDALVKHPDCNIIKHILDSKKIQNGTLKYFKAWLEEHINPTTGCIHPNFKSNGTDTGRMASSDPNMQNIPPHLRHLIIARDGYDIITVDFSQFEFRAAAAYTMEQYLIDTYNERAELLPLLIELGKQFKEPDPDHFVKEAKKGKYDLTKGQKELVDRFAGTDIHRRNASLVLNLPINEITDKHRSLGKTLGYALLYGAGPRRMLDQLIVSGFYDTTLADCNMYGQTFMKQLPKVSSFISEIHERVLDPGFIETFMGRKRFFPLPPPYQTRYYEQKLEDAKRQAVNAVFQSSNADATKLSMVVGGQVLERAFADDIPLMLLNVHDEIVTEAKKDYSAKAAEIVVNVMTESGERSLDYKVPIEVSMSIGSAWKK